MRWRQVIIIGFLLVLTGAPAAYADHNGHEFATAEECMQSGFGGMNMPSCHRSGGGPWVAQYGPPGAGGGPDGAFGAFILFALVWSAAPTVISGLIASDRGQSVGLAVLLGIFLGWIGLIIVVLAFKPEVTRAARNVIDSAANRQPLYQPGPKRDTRSRLEELERLKREKLITEEEYAARRATILSDI